MANTTSLTENQINALSAYAVGLGSEGHAVAPAVSLAGRNSGYAVGIMQWDFGERNSSSSQWAELYNNFISGFEASPQAATLTSSDISQILVSLPQSGNQLQNSGQYLSATQLSALNAYVSSSDGLAAVNQLDQAAIGYLSTSATSAANLVAASGSDQDAQAVAAAMAAKLTNQTGSDNAFTNYLQGFVSQNQQITVDDIGDYADNLSGAAQTGFNQAFSAANIMNMMADSNNATLQAVYSDMVNNLSNEPASLVSQDGLYDLGERLITANPDAAANIIDAINSGATYSNSAGSAANADGFIAWSSTTQTYTQGTFASTGGVVVIWNKDGTAFVIQNGVSTQLDDISDIEYDKASQSMSIDMPDGSTIILSQNQQDTDTQYAFNATTGAPQDDALSAINSALDLSDQSIGSFTGGASLSYVEADQVDAAGDMSASVSGSGAPVALTGAAITLDADASATVTGGTNSLSLGSGSSATLTGTGETVNASIANLTLGAGSSAQVFGTYDTLAAQSGSGGLDTFAAVSSGQQIVNGFADNNTNGATAATANSGDTSVTVEAYSGGSSTPQTTTISVNSNGDTSVSTAGSYLANYVAGLDGQAQNTTGWTQVASNDPTIGLSNGQGVTVATTSGQTITAGGTNPGIVVDGAGGNQVSVGANNSAIVVGSNDQASAAAGATLSLAGDLDTINGPSSGPCTLDVTGNSDNVDSSNASVTLGTNSTSDAVTGSSDTIAEGSDDSVNVYGSSETVNFNGGADYVGLLNGNGATDVVNNDVAGDSVNIASNTSATINGTGGYFGIVGSDITVTASGDSAETLNDVAFTLDGSDDSLGLGAGSSIVVNGGDNTVGLNGTDNALISSGSGNVVNNDDATTMTSNGPVGDIVNLGSNTSTTINGAAGYFGIVGTDVQVTASGETANTFSAVSFTLTGSNDVVDLNTNSSATLSGSSNTLNLEGGDYEYVESGTADVVNNDVSGDTVNLGSNTSTTITGTGGYFGIVGTGVTVTASGESADTFSGASFTLTGGNDVVDLNTNSSSTLNGSSNTLNLEGDDSAEIAGGASDIVNNDVSGDSVNIASNTSATITGSGGAIGLDGSGDDLTASDETITAAASVADETIYGSNVTINADSGFIGTVIGNDNTIETTANTSSSIDVDGTGDLVLARANVDNSTQNSVAIEGSDSNATVDGGNFTVDLTAAGQTVTMGPGSYGDLISTASGADSETINDQNSTIDAGSNSSLTVNGSGNTLNLNGGDNAEIASGTGEIVSNDVSGDAVNLASNTSTTINGIGGYFGIVGTNVQVNASGDSAETWNDVSFNLTGNDDSLGLGAGSSIVVNGGDNTVDLNGTDNAFISSGSSNVVNNDDATTMTDNGPVGDIVNLGSNTSTTINGTGGYFGIVGTGVTVAASGESADTFSGASFTLTGSNNVVDLNTNSSATLNGSSNTLNLEGDDSAEIAGGVSDIVNNDVSGDGVNIGSDTSATITGTGGYFGIVGTDVTVTASGDSAETIAGASFTLEGDNDNIGIGANSSATVNGSNDVVGMNGSDETVTASDDTINTAANAIGDYVYGSSDTVNASGGFSGNVYGGSDTVNFNGGADYVGLLNGNGVTDVVNNDVAGDSVNIASNTSATINGTGGYFGIVGTDVEVTASGDTAETTNGATFTLNGSSDVIDLAVNASVTGYGSGDTINMSGGDYEYVASGTGDIVNNDVSGDAVNLASDTSTTIYGTGGYFGIVGTNVQVIASGDSAETWNDVSFNLTGNDDNVSVGTGSYIGLIAGDQSDTINASGDEIVTQNDVTGTFNGSDDTINLGENTSVTAVGTENSINMTGAGTSATVDGANTVDVFGANETLTLGSTGDIVVLANNATGEVIYGNGETVDLGLDDTATISGTGPSSSAIINYVDGSSTNEVFDPQSNILVQFTDYSDPNLTGSVIEQGENWTGGGSQIVLYSGLEAGVSLETNNYTGANGTGALTSADFNFTAGGSEIDVYNPQSGVSLQFTDYTDANETGPVIEQGENWTGGGSQIVLYSGLEAGVSLETNNYAGANGTGTLTSADFNFTAGGSESDVYNPQSGVTDQYTGYSSSGSILYQGDNWSSGGSQIEFYNPASGVSSATENWSGGDGTGELTTETVQLTDGSSADASFSYNASGSESSETVDYYNSSGGSLGYEVYNGDGDALGGNYDGGDYDDGGYGDGGGYGGGDGGGYDFAKSSKSPGKLSGTDIGAIAQYDLSDANDPLAAKAAENARRQASTAATSSAEQKGSVFEAAKWDSTVITWSVATTPGTAADPFSNYLNAQEEGIVAQAFQTWAAASGLTFEEVPDSSQSDIRIGLGDFDTSLTGIVGYTSFATQGGQMQPDAIIRLEDPAETPLSAGSDGQLTYSGTQAEFYQVALHEIGHALGLADNSDPNSVMYYESTANNRTLDQTDVNGIRQLYNATGQSSTAGSVQTDLGVNLLVQAMASFNTQMSSTGLTALPVHAMVEDHILAAAAHVH
ncbi:matrixin family metalloprotease [Methylocapsa sp. S129]|uniref:matrixin family metalloprotease n=1 Tax=Methylocapsa sp. S129 TaxID=1641869 RepID=UPI00131A6432|nr:matrixin family metalloprotease [Methylocapsa sp. S129]